MEKKCKCGNCGTQLKWKGRVCFVAGFISAFVLGAIILFDGHDGGIVGYVHGYCETMMIRHIMESPDADW
jgi:hypothetical protein